MIENYIKKDDVIKCELNLTFIEKTDSLFDFYTWLSRSVDRLSQIAVAKNFDRLSQIAFAKSVDRLSQIVVAKRFAERIIIRFLKRREIE
jgi:hypothetical protein